MSGVLGGITNGEAYPRGFPTGSRQDIAKVRQIRFAFTGHFKKPQNVITNGIHISIQAGRGGRAYTREGGGGLIIGCILFVYRQGYNWPITAF